MFLVFITQCLLCPYNTCKQGGGEEEEKEEEEEEEE